MSDFEYVLLCFLVPIAYVVIYIAGKYDIISLLCKRLEEVVKEYSEKQENEKSMSDLISRSALLEKMTEEYKKYYAGTGTGYDFTIAMNMVQQQPTIEAVPVVRGEWVDDTGCLDSVRQYKCSNCGKKPIVNMNYVSILSDFCTNCGADMRKGGAK